MFLFFLFFFFDAGINGIVLLNFLSDSSLLVYGNATHFCILILFPVTLLSWLLVLTVLMESLVFSIHSIMSSANSDSFTSSFLIWNPFFSFLWLIVLDRTFNTTLNKSGESESSYILPNLRRKAFSFSLLSVMLAVGLS